MTVHFHNNESSSPSKDLCQVWLKCVQWRSRKCKKKMADWWTDGRRKKIIRKVHLTFNSGDRKHNKFYESATKEVLLWSMTTNSWLIKFLTIATVSIPVSQIFSLFSKSVARWVHYLWVFFLFFIIHTNKSGVYVWKYSLKT